MSQTANVAIVGAGIAGVSAAFHLSVRHDVGNVVVVDPRPPLTLTSDKSTECYRNWWPNQPMVDLMNRSIDIYEDLANEVEYGFNQRGYLFVTGRDDTYRDLVNRTEEIAELGAQANPLDRKVALERYPFLTPETVGGIYIERAGWFRAQDLGQWMLDRAKEHGVSMIGNEVVAIESGLVQLAGGDEITTDQIVIAAGPMSGPVAGLAGIDVPLFSELHLKVAFKDHLGVIPRSAPMTIWNDTQIVDWSESEREALAEMGRDELLGEMPIYCHFRPEGGEDSPWVVALWEYHDMVMEPIWPLPEDDLYPEVVMRGLATMVPGLEVYLDHLPESVVDGGYYTKTPENRPVVGPSGVDGVHLLAGFSGFGVMVAAGAADLLAAHITGTGLPDYSDAFLLNRYDNPTYLSSIETAETGQL